MTTQPTTAEPWRDPAADPGERVRALMARMTLREKLAQLYGVWVGIDSGGEMAPHQHDFVDAAVDFDDLVRHGIGQLTRVFGTRPVDPVIGAHSLARTQRQIVASSRFGIPAVVHEECLTGLAAWQATIYPAPLSWGATFDPDLVRRMAAKIGRTMRELGVHHIPAVGLAKRFEELFVPDEEEPVVLPRGSEALYLVQRVRDEAHRFAITFHRQVRGKSSIQSALDTIPGIGPKRKRALLKKFGSVKQIREADVAEIASTLGFTTALAEKVKSEL